MLELVSTAVVLKSGRQEQSESFCGWQVLGVWFMNNHYRMHQISEPRQMHARFFTNQTSSGVALAYHYRIELMTHS